MNLSSASGYVGFNQKEEPIKLEKIVRKIISSKTYMFEWKTLTHK